MKKLLLFIFTLLLPLVANADAFVVNVVNIDGIYYKLYDKDKTAVVTDYPNFKYSGEVTIPAAVTYNDNQYSVTTIEDWAFYGCHKLTSINIPNSVTRIGLYVFKGCSGLTSITIPNSVTSIGTDAFSGCSGLTSITIPNSVRYIDCDAFFNCTGLTSITIPNSVTTIGGGAFLGCKLTSITVKATVVPELLEKDDIVFSKQSLYHTTLLVPNGTWYDYAYDDNWYTFHTIRETAFAADEVAESRAFTLKDTKMNNYLCYDKVNKSVGTIATEGLNEDEPNNAWMLANVDGKQYIYNLGSKKFLAVARNEAKSTRAASDGIGFILTDEPTPVTLSNGTDGISVNGVKEFYFVVNQKLNIDNSVVSKIEETTGIDKVTTDDDHGSVYNLNGQKVNKGYRGIIIKNGKKVITK